MFLRIISIIGSLTFLSRLLGYSRDLLVALIFGASYVSDAFFVSFKLPNLFRRLFAEGAMNSAFIPVVSGIKEKDGPEKAVLFLNEIFSILFSFLLPFILIIELFMPLIVMIVAPGFEQNSVKYNLTVNLSRLSFPFLLFICLSSLIGGYLNTMGKFAAMAFTPVILNLSMLSVLVLFINNENQELISKYLASSISLAGVIQLIWLFYHLKINNIKIKFSLKIFDKVFKFSKDAKKLFILFLPAVIGNGVYQINLLIDMILASTLPDGFISYLYFADRINQLPLGVFGIALSTALLPVLSRQIKKKENTSASQTLNHCLQLGIIFSVPCAFGLAFLAEPILSVLFVRGEFSVSDAQLTSKALMALCIGLPAFISVKIIAASFFAKEDTKTPVYVAVFSMLINLILNLILIQKYLHVGLALATSISSWLNFFVLVIILRKRELYSVGISTIKVFIKSLIASSIMILVTKFLLLSKIFDSHIEDFLSENFFILSSVIIFSSFVYLILIYFLGMLYLLKIKKGETN